MARKPGDRYRSARQLSRALRTWISDETNGVGHNKTMPRSWAGWLWAGGGTAAVALIAAAWVFTSQQPAQEEAVTAAAAAAAAAASTPQAAAAASEPVTVPLPPTPVAEAPAPPAPKAAVTRPARPKETRTSVVREPAPAPPPAAAAPTQGVLQLAVSPWGQVEVDGKPMGTTPPLSRLTLPVGTHQVVIRNEDAVHATNITVTEDKPVTLRHRFGS
jgi:serine/threonine-protein kinase